MKRFLTYRTLALALAAIFFIFNIGLPIVVASCPMTVKSGQSGCTMCSDQSAPSAERLTVAKDKSCCATIIAAKRNTNEFVQVTTTIHDVTKAECSSIVSFNPHPIDTPTFGSHTNVFSSSPPFSRDIPLLTSSLLI